MNKDCVLLAVRENRLRRLEAARLLAASGVSCVFEKEPLRIGKRIEEDLERVVVLDREGYSPSFLRALEEYQKVSPGLVIVYLCENGNATDKQLTYHDRRISYVEYAHMKGALANAVCLARRESEILSLHPSDYQRKHPFLIVAKDTMGITSGPDKWAITQKEEETDLVKKERNNRGISRRTFLKGSAAAAAVAAVASMTGCGDPSQGTTAAPTEGTLEEVPTTTGKTEPAPLPEDTLYNSPCRSNCFQSCTLNAHVRDGKVVRMSPKDYPNPDYTGCCLKGLTIPQRTYSATRIKYPMRRVGERGEDKWERVSWEEALKEIAEKFNTIQKTYGTQSLLIDTASGNYGLVHGTYGMSFRMAYVLGASKVDVSYDAALGTGTDRALGGGLWLHGNEITDFYNSKLIYIWGSNPVHAQPQNWRILAKAQKLGAKLVCIDPIRSATAAKCDEYIPIQPGSDLLLVMAMMKIILEKGWADETFMKTRSTSPCLVRKDTGKYLKKSDFTALAEGEEDVYYVWDKAADKAVLSTEATEPALEGTYTVEGIECTTAFSLLKDRINETDVDYAAKKTGISKDKIVEMTDNYVHSGASGIYTVYGIDHYQNGHLFGFAIACLATLSGNLAKPGCSLTGFFVNRSMTVDYAGLYTKEAQILQGIKGMIPSDKVGEVFRTQQFYGGPFPVKAMYTSCSNSMSNFAQQNQWFDDILPNLEYWVVVDTEMTDSARYADMVLPAAFWLEVDDLRSNYNNPYLTIQEKAIDPLYESKSDSEIIRLILTEMGYGAGFPEKTDKEWIQVLMDLDLLKMLGFTYERLMEEKIIHTVWNGAPYIYGESSAFPTQQGLVRVYCEDPLPRNNHYQDLSAVYEKERMPYFKAPNEAWDENPLFEKYPLVFIQDHSRFRSHSQWFNTPILRELDPEPYIRMNPDDAAARGLKEGDIAEAYNDRGHAVAKLRLDPAVKPGVMTMPKGWQREQFIAGCYQELTNTSSDPMASNFAYFDTLVEVRKYEGGK